MLIALHKNARTTPAVRAEIAASTETAAVLAQRYGITEQTVYKWKKRQSFNDRSHTAHRLQTQLTLMAQMAQRLSHTHPTEAEVAYSEPGTCWPLHSTKYTLMLRRATGELLFGKSPPPLLGTGAELATGTGAGAELGAGTGVEVTGAAGGATMITWAVPPGALTTEARVGNSSWIVWQAAPAMARTASDFARRMGIPRDQ